MSLSNEEKEIYKKMGDNLGKIRGDYSQADISKIISMKASNYNTIECGRGERHLKDIQIIKLAKYYNTSSDFILGLTKTKSSDVEVKAIYEQFGLTEESLYFLQQYKNEKILQYTINAILRQPSIIKELANYLVISCINEIIYEKDNSFLLDFISYNFYINNYKPDKLTYFAKVLEILPLLKDSIKKKLTNTLETDNADLLFEYIDKECKEQNPLQEDVKVDINDLQEAEKHFNEIIEQFTESKENKELMEKYEKFKLLEQQEKENTKELLNNAESKTKHINHYIQVGGENNECKGNRKK